VRKNLQKIQWVKEKISENSKNQGHGNYCGKKQIGRWREDLFATGTKIKSKDALELIVQDEDES